MALIEYPGCPPRPKLMFALYDDFALFREDPVCATDRPVLKIALTPEQRKELVDDIDVNPLLSKAQSPVEFCPRCVGREIDFIAFGRGTDVFKVAVIGAESGEDPEATNAAQRDGARAAAALLRSLDRLRSRLIRLETQVWTEEAFVLSRLHPDDPMARATRCRWPGSWPVPAGIRDVAPGNSILISSSAKPSKEEFNSYTRKCPVIEMDGRLFSGRVSPTFPGQAQLGPAFFADLIDHCD